MAAAAQGGLDKNGDPSAFELRHLRTAEGRCTWRPRHLDLQHLRTAEGPKYDFAGEQLHWEGTPHRGDRVTNLALGATLLWLPLTAAAVGRGAFMKFRFTDKRVSVITSAPWKSARPARLTRVSVPCASETAHCACWRRCACVHVSSQILSRPMSTAMTASRLVRALPVLVGCPGAARLLKAQGEGRDAPAGGCLHDPGPLEQALLTAVSCMFKGAWRLLPPGMTQVLWVHARFGGALPPPCKAGAVRAVARRASRLCMRARLMPRPRERLCALPQGGRRGC